MNEFSPRSVIQELPDLLQQPAAAQDSDFEILESSSAEEMLRWALGRWGRKMAVVTSFQAAGMVLLDMAWRIDPRVRILTLDTGRLHQESFDLMDRVRERYGLEIEIISPDPGKLEEMVRTSGPNLFYRSRQDRRTCCQVRKVEPLGRALSGLGAWVTGLRREQAWSRVGVKKAEWDPRYGDGNLLKLCPLADWSHDRVWSYLRARGVPVHPLYGKGFTSIGCQPCTRPTGDGEDPRAGRWWWEESDHKECGLHLVSLASGSPRGNLAGAPP